MKTLKMSLVLVFCFGLVQFCLAQIEWEKYINNPVFTDTIGEWTGPGAFSPCVVFDGNTYHIWYVGYDSTSVRIGYASSLDGIEWEPYINNPVIDLGEAGSWEETWVNYPFVIYDGSIFHMWYTGIMGNFSTLWTEHIGYATSPDGISWTKYADNPVINPGPPGSWDDYSIDLGCVIYDGMTYHLWYGGNDGSYIRIGYATSPDSTNWTKYANNPVLDLGDWDSPRIYQARVVHDGNNFHMLYGGGNIYTWRIGYASSDDGISWTKYADNPVLDVGEPGSWEDSFVAIPSVMLDTLNSIFRMWYAGGRDQYTGSIGYATAPFDTVAGIEDNNFLIDIPQKYTLSQNYPNPFNPSTTIEFTLPKSELTTLKVYNILGKGVATLVSNKLNQGNHTYTFDGKNLASGVYYYQLVAGEYREVKKMILLR